MFQLVQSFLRFLELFLLLYFFCIVGVKLELTLPNLEITKVTRNAFEGTDEEQLGSAECPLWLRSYSASRIIHLLPSGSRRLRIMQRFMCSVSSSQIKMQALVTGIVWIFYDERSKIRGLMGDICICFIHLSCKSLTGAQLSFLLPFTKRQSWTLHLSTISRLWW